MLISSACANRTPEKLSKEESDRARMIRWLGGPRRTTLLASPSGSIDRNPAPLVTPYRVDEYRISGRVQLFGDRYGEESNLYPMVVIMTGGIAELIGFPLVTVDLTILSMKRYEFRVWYDRWDRLLAYERRQGKRRPTALASARGLRELAVRPVPHTGNLRVAVKAAGTARSCVAYYCWDLAIEAPEYLPVIDRGVSSLVFIGKRYNTHVGRSFGHKLRAGQNTSLLIFQCVVTNTGTGTAQFRPMDLRLGASEFPLGIGAGVIPFTMDPAVWKKFKDLEPEKIPAGRSKPYTYVFEVDREQSRWDLHYQGKLVCEVERKEK